MHKSELLLWPHSEISPHRLTRCSLHMLCRYRTFFKPTYKVGHKTVTELEWRCCPGYSGENCHDGSTPLPGGTSPPGKGAPLPHRPGIRGYPHGPKPTVDHKPGEGQIEQGGPIPGIPDQKPIPTGHLPAGNGKPNQGEDIRMRAAAPDTHAT